MRASNSIFYILALVVLTACGSEKSIDSAEKPIEITEEQVAPPIPTDTFLTVSVFLDADVVLSLRSAYFENIDESSRYLFCQDIDNDQKLMLSIEKSAFDRQSFLPTNSKVLPMNLTTLYKGEIEQPFRVSIRHKVLDLEKWKWLYDSNEESRINAGLTLIQFGTLTGDSNDVFMIYAIPDIAQAREILQGPNLKKRMEQSGVVGDPEIHFWRPLE